MEEDVCRAKSAEGVEIPLSDIVYTLRAIARSVNASRSTCAALEKIADNLSVMDWQELHKAPDEWQDGREVWIWTKYCDGGFVKCVWANLDGADGWVYLDDPDCWALGEDEFQSAYIRLPVRLPTPRPERNRSSAATKKDSL